MQVTGTLFSKSPNLNLNTTRENSAGMYQKPYAHLASVLCLFGVGIALFGAGMATQSAPILYSSAGVSTTGIVAGIIMYFRQRRPQPTFDGPQQPQRVYRDPGMKRNKSDTDLQLIGAAKNTTDDEVPV
jgi:hypothetical protein